MGRWPLVSMMNLMAPKLFIDTWGWLTLNDRKETHHQEATIVYRQFLAEKGLIYTTDYVLDEAYNLLKPGKN